MTGGFSDYLAQRPGAFCRCFPPYARGIMAAKGSGTMDSLSKRILEEYSIRPSMNLLQLSSVLNTDFRSLAVPVNYLLEKGLLQIEPNYAMLRDIKQSDSFTMNTQLEISHLGRIALEEEQKICREKRNELIRYIITTAIAVAAFLKSFFFPG